jgi:signal transduction histidine kinase
MSDDFPSLERFSGEFAAPAHEREFRMATFAQSSRRTQIFLWFACGALAIVLGLVWQRQASTAIFLNDSTPRIAVLALATLFLWLSYRTPSWQRLDNMAAVTYFCMFGLTAIYSADSGLPSASLITRNLIIVFLGYLIRPTRMVYMVSIGCLLSGFMVGQVLNVPDVTRPEITAAIASAIIINVVGYFASRDTSRNLRINYLLRSQSDRFAYEAEVSRAQAEKANRSKTEFLAALNHELRNPLNSVVGFCEVLNQSFDETTTEMQRESVGYIASAGKHMVEITDQVLDLARMESGFIELNPEEFKIGDMIRNCMGMIDIEARQHQLTAQADIPAPSPVVWADATRARQVLLNLLSNAIKYNHDGGSISVTVHEVPQAIRIAVTDTGEGIPEERYDELFEPFNRLEMEGRNIKGSGIGLSIAKKIVDAMAGRMGVESVVGEGSTFWYELPLPVAKE